MTPSRDIGRLLEIMAALRDPQHGCPWDIRQSFETIAPYTIEEAYEVADAIQRGDLQDLKDELGDLLLQVVFHARLAEEAGTFAFQDVIEAITTKLIRRHPHVFGTNRERHMSPEGVKRLWEEIKQAEKAERARSRSEATPGTESVLSGVPTTLPALIRAEKLSRKAASVGFDWPDKEQVIAKIREEIGEVEEALAEGHPPAVSDEIGDLLFAVANLARHAGIDAESALRGANAKFERRFCAVEAALSSEGRNPAAASLEEMEALWQATKRTEAD